MSKKIHTQNIKHVIGHNGSIYIKSTIVTILLLFLLWVIFILAKNNLEFTYLSWMFGGLGIIVLGKYIIDFLNLYLDGLALSPEGITLFMREGLLEYKTECFDRDKIVTINHHQKGIWDKLFHKGDLLINLEQGIEFPFENISAPKKQVDKVMRLKEYYIHQNLNKNDLIPESIDKGDDEHMKIVMEAFSEVVKDYMGKKGEKPDYEENSEFF